ncbi:hypothetical protein BH20VER1_BH20VER1_20820 [soil metagenome]
MSLLIKNGEIVTAEARYVADIYCEDETMRNIQIPTFKLQRNSNTQKLQEEYRAEEIGC